MQKIMLLLLLTCLAILETTFASDEAVTSNCSEKFYWEYNMLLKLIELEQRTSQQEANIAALTKALDDTRDTLADSNANAEINKFKNAQGSTYVRWGRTTCPDGAYLVYDGYAGGSYFTHSGSGSNTLCLPKDPIYDKYKAGFQDTARIYGAEYETHSHNSWSYLAEHDIPCAVCRIQRSHVLMIPAKNVCHKNYVLEYKGYLMSSYHSYSASDYICFDNSPEKLSGGEGDKEGRLFYLVESVCGSLRCPPYAGGKELTCAVCSYSPNDD